MSPQTDRAAGGPTLSDIAEVVGSYVDLSEVQVGPESTLGEEIPIGSQDMLRVLSRIQAKYGIAFGPRDILSLTTLGQLLEAVRRLIGERQQP